MNLGDFIRRIYELYLSRTISRHIGVGHGKERR